MAQENIEAKVEKKLKPIIENLGYSLYDVLYEKEGKDYYLRIIIDKDGTIRFKEPEVFFNKGESELKIQFKDILDSFFPRYINVIYENYKDKVTEIRIEGHTSSEWEEREDTKTAYFKNMELSQDRTRNVLEYVMNMPSLSKYEEWLIDNITANGMSYSHRIYNNGVEDKDASRRVEFRVITNSEKTINDIIDNYKECVDNFVYSIPKLKNNNYLF